MTEQNALAIYRDFDGLQRAAMALYESGYFSDAKSKSQAIVKVMAGAEVGIPPFASMSGVNIIKGTPTFSANLIATLVDNDPRYSYRVKKATDTECVIEWFQGGVKVGESSFTIEEAKKIKQWNKKKGTWEPLTDKMAWKNYPSDLLFARTMTRGQKRFAAGVAGGAPIYTPEELGAEADEDGNIIDSTSVIIEEPNAEDPQPEPEQEEPEQETLDIDEPMTIERAYKIKNSDGKFYKDLDSETLSNMSIGIGKELAKKYLAAKRRKEYEDKQEAIKVLLQARADGSVQ
ncbi:MAG: hypothetical protein JRD89_20360 [Deltaproteobacteria bacterium]|nr:hypothetical protein [Deltaproteobacteria bacterium]